MSKDNTELFGNLNFFAFLFFGFVPYKIPKKKQYRKKTNVLFAKDDVQFSYIS